MSFNYHQFVGSIGSCQALVLRSDVMEPCSEHYSAPIHSAPPVRRRVFPEMTQAPDDADARIAAIIDENDAANAEVEEADPYGGTYGEADRAIDLAWSSSVPSPTPSTGGIVETAPAVVELLAAIEAVLPALPRGWAGCTTMYQDRPVECPCHMHTKIRRLMAAMAAVVRVLPDRDLPLPSPRRSPRRLEIEAHDMQTCAIENCRLCLNAPLPPTAEYVRGDIGGPNLPPAQVAQLRFLIVACSTCGAPVDRHCASRTGQPTMPHTARMRLAEAQPEFTPLVRRTASYNR